MGRDVTGWAGKGGKGMMGWEPRDGMLGSCDLLGWFLLHCWLLLLLLLLLLQTYPYIPP